jgi:Na+/melibiose symporter-like transporter
MLQKLIQKDGQTELMDKDNYLPLRQISFRKLLWVFLLNGIASAVPAGLVMFFIEDQIQASAAMSPLFLGVYFLSGALSLPLWLKLVRAQGLAKSWLIGMALAIMSFGSVVLLGPGDLSGIGHRLGRRLGGAGCFAKSSD